MSNNGELRLAIAGFLAGVLLIGGAIGLYLLFVTPELAKCADPDACLEPTADFLERYGDATSCDWYELHVCIVPLGDVPLDLVDRLVAYYEAEYGLRVSVLRPITLKPGMDTERPGQVEADLLREYFYKEYFVYDQSDDAILIGLTAIDIYTDDRPEWNWFFGQTYRFQGADGPRQAIISTYRMDPVSWGQPADNEVRDRRVRTLMNKYIALTFYGLELNDNPSSVLYRQISSLGDLDRINERIPIER